MKFTANVRRLAALVLAVTLLLPSCGLTPPTAAATMHLRQTEGTVDVSDSEGKDVEPREDLGLYSGYGVETKRKSYAWIDLDEVKLTKLDEKSEIGITKDGKNLEIEVLSGSLFFYVTEPLKDDETMTIRSSTMAVGIRGTCGWVTLEGDGHLTLYLLEGKAECTAGEEAVRVSAGEMARMSIKDEAGEITVSSFAEADIPAFVRDELDEDFLEEIRGFLPQGLAPEALAALQSIHYYGDPSRCTMTPEQAAAFAQVIRDNMASLEADKKFFEDNFNGHVIVNAVDCGTLDEHPPTGTAALFDLGDGTPALIFGGALINRILDNGTYHWLNSGISGIWLYQDGTAVQHTPNTISQSIFDGYLLISNVFGPPYEVYPIENGAIAALPSASAEMETVYAPGPYVNTLPKPEYHYYIDGAEVAKDAFDAWVDQWAHAEPYPDNWGSPAWGDPQSLAGFAGSTDIPWGSWGMYPAQDVLAVLDNWDSFSAP